MTFRPSRLIPDTAYSTPIAAAGAVVWRGPERLREIVLVHRPRGDWSFPKGKVAHGEQLAAAALREVREETGLGVHLGPWLGRTSYLKDGWPKRVDYFAAQVDPARCGAFTPSDEIDDLRWVPVSRAAGVLSRPGDIPILHELERRITMTTTSLVLLRHASMAGDKADWQGRKKHRPLDAAGFAAAEAIASMLAAYGPVVLHSADSVRCLQTLQPYAQASGVVVRGDKRLRGKHFDADFALRLAGESLDTGRPAVICAHRSGLQVLFTELCRRRAAAVPTDTTVPKAGLIVLHGLPGKIVHIERHLAR